MDRAPKQTWSDWDDVMLRAWMAIYERPLTPPLTFHIINGSGERVSVSSLDVDHDGHVRPWWCGWSYIPPVTIVVEDSNGKGFELRLPASAEGVPVPPDQNVDQADQR